jgi:hypothetical protein
MNNVPLRLHLSKTHLPLYHGKFNLPAVTISKFIRQSQAAYDMTETDFWCGITSYQ